MGNTVSPLIQQVVIMFMIMMLGYLLFKKKKLTPTGSSQMSFLVLYISTPITILESMMTEYSTLRVVNGLYVFIAALIILMLSAVLAKFYFKTSGSLEQFAVIFSNTGFLGIPLIQNVPRMAKKYLQEITKKGGFKMDEVKKAIPLLAIDRLLEIDSDEFTDKLYALING